jgi:acyl-CoA synthetase (NDP forming)
MMTDEAIARGLAVQPLSPETVEKLRPLVPSFAALGNPIDLTAAIFDDTDLCRKALELIIEDPLVDSVAMANAGLQGEVATKVAREIVNVARRSDKPIMLGWSARREVAGVAYSMLDELKIPHYRSPMRCMRALAALTNHALACGRHEARKREPLLALSNAESKVELAACLPATAFPSPARHLQPAPRKPDGSRPRSAFRSCSRSSRPMSLTRPKRAAYGWV